MVIVSFSLQSPRALTSLPEHAIQVDDDATVKYCNYVIISTNVYLCMFTDVYNSSIDIVTLGLFINPYPHRGSLGLQ